MPGDSQPVFQVEPYSDPVVVRICGRASFQNSAPLSTFFQEMAMQGLSGAPLSAFSLLLHPTAEKGENC